MPKIFTDADGNQVELPDDFTPERYNDLSKKDCDYIVGLCPEKNRCFVFPIEECASRRQASFYFDSPPKGRARGKEWAASFEDKWPSS